MDPIWLVPAAVCTPVIIWKAKDAISLLNSERHLVVLGIYISADYLLYWLAYYLGVGISERLAGAAWVSDHPAVIHSGVIVSFLSVFIFLLHMSRRTVKKVGPPAIKRMLERFEYAAETAKDADETAEKARKGMSDIEDRIEDQRKEHLKKYEEVKRDVEERYENVNEKVSDLDRALDDHEEMMEDHSDRMDEVKERVKEVVSAVSDLREELKSFRGGKGEEEGLDYQNGLGRWFTRLGYEAEVNERSGADVVVKEPRTGEPILVAGAKAYKLNSRRGLSDEFDPEVEMARKLQVPFVAAIRNKQTGLELFRVYEPEELEDFTCSAPSWLAGKEATEGNRGRERRSREALRGLLFRESGE